MKSGFFSYNFYVFVNVSSLYISTSSQVPDYEQDLMKQNYNFNPQNSFLKMHARGVFHTALAVMSHS